MLRKGLFGVAAMVILMIAGALSTFGQTWDGGGATNNWSDPLNWSTDTVPNTGANVTFNTTSTKDCVIDVNITSGTFLIDTGYTGTISQGSSNITVNSSFNHRDGTFQGGTGFIDLNGFRGLTGGTFISTTGDLFFTGNGNGLTIDAEWNFDPNGGTLVIDGGQTISMGGTVSELTVNNFAINMSSNSDGFSLGSTTRTLVVQGSLDFLNGQFTDGQTTGNLNRRIRALGPVTFDPSYDGGAGTLELAGDLARTVTLPVGMGIVPRLIVNAPNTSINTAGIGLHTLRDLNLISAAGVTNGDADFRFSGTVTINSNFTQGSGGLTFDGSFIQNSATFTGGTGFISFNANRSFNAGNFIAPVSTTTFRLSGVAGSTGVTMEDAWSFNPNSGTVRVESNPVGSSSISVSGTNTLLPLHNLEIEMGANAHAFSLGGTGERNWLVAGELRLLNGQLTGGNDSARIMAEGSVLVSPDFDGGNGRVHFSGDATRTIEIPSGATMPRLTVNAPNTTVNYTGNGGVTMTRTDLLSAASFNTNDVDVTFSGSVGTGGYLLLETTMTQGAGNLIFNDAFTQNSGTFTGGTGTIQMNTSRNFNGGTFIAPSSTTTFRLSGAAGSTGITMNDGWSFNPNSGTVRVESNPVGSSSISVSGTNTLLPLHNLEIEMGANAHALSLGTSGDRNWLVAGQLHLVNGIVNGAATRFIRADGNVLIEAGFDGGNVPITYSGSAEQNFESLGGNHPIGAVTIDKPSGSLNLLSDMNLSNGTVGFALTNGTISTGDFAVLSGTRSVTRTNGYIIGDLDRRINSTGVREYPVGTEDGYSPVTANITTLGTNPTQLRIGAKQGTHPRLDASTSLGRYWPITENGNVTATLTFNYFDSDVNGSETNYRLHRIATSELQIFQPPQATLDTTANTATVTGITEFSDWTLAEVGQPVSISPSTGTFAPGSVINFSAIAGYPPYSFSIIQDNSGAGFDPQTATYTAGNTIGVQDIIRVTDSFGFISNATITVDIIPTRLVITAQPVSTTAGLILNAITAELQDDVGNRAATATNAVTIAIANNPEGATLFGTTTRNAVAGIATFNDLSIQRAAEGYTLAVSSSGLIGSTSSSFNIDPGNPSQLAFLVQPADTEAFAAIGPPPQIAIQDQFGNTVTTAEDVISISIANNPGSAQLGGTIFQQTSNGVASFPDLSINQVGEGYTLAANGNVGQGQSDPFNITRPLLTVTNTDQSGPGSLSFALSRANALAGTDTVHFNIPGAGPHAIFNPELAEINDPIDLDASTQPGFTGTPIIQISNGSSGVGLSLNAGNSSIRGIAFTGGAHGIYINSIASNSQIKGNYFGVDPSGLPSLRPESAVTIAGANNLIIGGTSSTDRNVINGGTAIRINGNSSNLSIQGNYIGTNAEATEAATTGVGIATFNANDRLIDSLIGGSGLGEGNLIATAFGTGILLNGDRNIIQGNLIGTDLTGNNPMPSDNGNTFLGIQIRGNQNLIGGDTEQNANTLAFLQHGLVIASPPQFQTGNRNLIRRNRIHSIQQLGNQPAVRLQPNGSFNDPLDADTGANDLQNFPDIATAIAGVGATHVAGTLGSKPSETYTLDFYSSDVCINGQGEARQYLGQTVATTDAGGITGFQVTLPVEVLIGKFVTATATDSINNTSELSRCMVVAPASAVISGNIGTSVGPLSNATVTLSGGRSASTTTDSFGNYSFRDLPTGFDYTVTASRATFEFSPPSRSFTNIVGDQPNANFTAQKTSFRITGTVGRLGGVTMTLAGTANRTTEANSAGTFRFDELFAGNYTLTPSKPGYTFTPTSVNLALSTEDAAANFSAASILSQLVGNFYFVEISGAIVATKSIRADGRGLRTVNGNLIPRSMYPSPDGRKLIFQRGRTISTIDFDGTNITFLTMPPSSPILQADIGPSYSRVGSRIAFVRSGGGASLFVAFSDGSNSNSLYSEPVSLLFPTWSPSGDRLALTRQGVLRIVTLDGGISQNSAPANVLMPRWSPTSDRILFGRSGSSISLFTIRDNFSEEIQVPLNGSNIGDRSWGWSPNGQFIHFTRFNQVSNLWELIVAEPETGSNVVVYSTSSQLSVVGIAWGAVPAAAVPSGSLSPVQVTLGGVTVTFADVQSEGELTVDPFSPNSLGTAPSGYSFTTIGYDIQTTAGFTPPVEVCIEVPETTATTAARFNRLTILHNENGSLVDRTTTRDIATRTVCAAKNGLSEFVVAEQIDPTLASITGLVVDSSGEPMANVSVRMTGAEERYIETDSDGLFTFPNLVNGANYEVQARAFGYIVNEFSKMFVNVNGEETVIFAGTRTDLSISGRVTNPVGTGLPGRTVELSGDRIATTTTDSEGNYVFTALPADGTYSVRPTGSSVTPNPEEITVSPLLSNTTGLDFIVLAPTSASVSVGGRVLDAAGRSIAKARVEIINAAGNRQTVLSNTFGYYRFDGIASGETYIISVVRKGFTFEPRTVSVSDEISDLDLVALGVWKR